MYNQHYQFCAQIGLLHCQVRSPVWIQVVFGSRTRLWIIVEIPDIPVHSIADQYHVSSVFQTDTFQSTENKEKLFIPIEYHHQTASIDVQHPAISEPICLWVHKLSIPVNNSVYILHRVQHLLLQRTVLDKHRVLLVAVFNPWQVLYE